MAMLISDIRHPQYSLRIDDWTKWRATFTGGQVFIDKYLRKLSKRETKEDFEDRKAVTYCPSFAKTGIKEIIEAIYQRMTDITRAGGSDTYNSAIAGLDGGVDLEGSSMNYFMGCKVLPELLPMQKVGIYMDMPPLRGKSIADNEGIRPYLYLYTCEDICCWTVDSGCGPNEYSSVLLREYADKIDESTGFPHGRTLRYKRVWREHDGTVMVAFYNDAGEMVDEFGSPSNMPIPLAIDRVPFVCLEIPESLLTDVADYQIALLNLASTDMTAGIKANFPIYTEQFEPKATDAHLRGGKPGDTQGTGQNGDTANAREISTGPTKGRRYPRGLDRPEFIHPSSEPLKISMEKQAQMKEEIRQLLRLSVSSLRGPKMASAESKIEDSRSLEAGLSYIGLVLQMAETKIAELWEMYEGTKTCATVLYPEDYSLNSDEERRKEASDILEEMQKIPSMTYQKALAKRAAKIMLGPKIAREEMAKIEKEIESAVNMNSDPETIRSDCEAGLVDLVTASKQRGWPAGSVEKAAKDHEERLKRIALSQTEGAGAARGVPDLGANPNAGKNEKSASRDTTTKDSTTPPVRGEGK